MEVVANYVMAADRSRQNLSYLITVAWHVTPQERADLCIVILAEGPRLVHATGIQISVPVEFLKSDLLSRGGYCRSGRCAAKMALKTNRAARFKHLYFWYSKSGPGSLCPQLSGRRISAR